MLRRVTDVLIVVLAFVFGAFMWRVNARLDKLEVAPRTASAARPPVDSVGSVANQGIVIGEASAPVTIVEFTDYQCPFCGKFASETLPVIYEKYISTGKVRLVVRDFPLDMHPNAQQYALASQCAATMTPRIYDFQRALYSKAARGDSVIRNAAHVAGLDTAALDGCIRSKRFQEVVKGDAVAAAKLGISGTPAFVIGQTAKMVKGPIIRGAYPTEVFTATIDSALSRKIAFLAR
jgi:protein-disulfide isomerase